MTSKGLTIETLGRTGIKVTRLGYGAMELRDAPRGRPVSEDQANRILNAVLDAGINMIDTSNDYGRSEEFIGRYISHRRSEYMLATKCGCHPDGHIWTEENLFRGLHQSLKRLMTEYVDAIQLHNATVEQCESGNLVETLQRMRDQGKVRWIGVSTVIPHLPVFLRWGVFDVFQIPYSALERDHEEWITRSARAGIGTIIRGGVAKGEPGPGHGREERWAKYKEAHLGELLGPGEDPTSFMLRFTLSHPYVHTTIVGTMTTEHLDANLRAARRGPLPPDIYAEARRRLDAIGVKPAPVT